MKRYGITLGCDPEFFIRHNGQVVGSERVLGEAIESGGGTIIRDGVQAELNPSSHYCRGVLMDNISMCLARVQGVLAGHTADFSQGVEITRDKFNELSDDCKRFGCKPSFNIDKSLPEVCLLDASEYLVRSAGGHIHLGVAPELVERVQDVERIIPVLDTLVGNTFVLLDRSDANVERRQHYGRAGEYRLPSYGIEYRTLSNYWLRHPTLASLAFGLARQAVEIVLNDLDHQMMALVNYDDVRRAIQENNFELALANWSKIKDFIVGLNDGDTRYPFDKSNIDGFAIVVGRGSDNVFGADVFDNWLEQRKVGAYTFFKNIV